MSWKDRTTSFDDKPNTFFPWGIQWINRGKDLDPRQPKGGFFQPLSRTEAVGFTIPGSVVTLINSEGGTEEGIYTASLEMAVITRRFRWKRGKGRNTQYAVGKRPGPGWRGQLHILALVRGADGNWHGPVAVTYTGLAGSSFQEAYRQFREAAETVVGEGTPLWQFFGTYQAGGTEMVGSEAKSPITTVVCDCDGGFDPEAQYIGDEMAQEVESLAEQVRAWRDAWRNAGNGDGGEGDTPTPKPKPKDPNAPASKAQWGLIRRLLTELGYEGEERQNKVLRKKGFDPANLTMGQASELIGRLQKARQNRQKKNGNGK